MQKYSPDYLINLNSIAVFLLPDKKIKQLIIFFQEVTSVSF